MINFTPEGFFAFYTTNYWKTNSGCPERKEKREIEISGAQRGHVVFLSVYVDDIKLAGKKQNINPTWKNLIKDVDLGELTSSFDHVYLGCT